MNKEFIEKLEAIVKELFTMEKINEYLDINAKFYYMPFYNLALIYKQNRNASILMGLNVWRNTFKKEIKEEAKPILCMFPKASDNFDFDIGTLYDIEDTKGDKIDFDIEVDIEDVIKKKGFIIYQCKKSEICSYTRYKIDIKEKSIYIDESLDKIGYKQELLKAYIDYKFSTVNFNISNSKQKKLLVNYTVLKSFNIDSPQARFIFLNDYKNADINFICDYLDDVQLMVFEILTDLTRPCFSFEEVSLFNQLLSEDKNDFLNTLNKEYEVNNIYNKILNGRFKDISQYIENINNDSYTKILKDRNEYKLVSFPLYYKK